MDENIQELADSIYREKVRRARKASPSKKMGWGAELFAEVCGRMRSGIRSQHPEATNAEVEAILCKRLDRLTRLHESGVFEKAPRR
jgi:hypothetical protein